MQRQAQIICAISESGNSLIPIINVVIRLHCQDLLVQVQGNFMAFQGRQRIFSDLIQPNCVLPLIWFHDETYIDLTKCLYSIVHQYD